MINIVSIHMPSKYDVFLRTASQMQTEAVAPHFYLNQKLWLKKSTKRHSSWIYVPLRWISKLLGLSVLAPVPNTGGTDAIACEVNRLKQLRKLGINVPEILAYADHAVLMKDASVSGQKVQQLESALASEVLPESRLALFQKVVQSIELIHSKKSYLSEAFARNILIDEKQNLAFIDFETDPAQVLSIQDCQTRDWLCLIFSTAQYFEQDELECVKEILLKSIDVHSNTFRDIALTGHKLRWLLKLKPEKLGKDGLRLKKCISLLNSLDEQQPIPVI